MGDNLLYSAIVRSSDRETLLGGTVCQGHNSEKDFPKIKEHMLGANLLPNERKKLIAADKSGWFCECDGNKVLFIVNVVDKYSDRLAYQYLNDLRKGISEVPNYSTLSASEVSKSFSSKFESLAKKYNDPTSIDKLAAVGKKVDEASQKTEASLRLALTNQQDLKTVEDKSEHVKNLSKNYNEDAEELRKIMYWRNMKLKIILSMMGVAAVFSVAMPVISKFTSS